MEINDINEEYEADAEGNGDNLDDDDPGEEEEQHFDIRLAASHSYMGGELTPVRGRVVLEEGWVGRVPLVAHHGAVFPGETVPLLLPGSRESYLLTAVIRQDRLFGLLCPDESGAMVSGYGVLCEVFEAGAEEDRLAFKARAIHRFRFLDLPKNPVPMSLYARMRYVQVTVLPEVSLGPPLRHVRLASLDPHRRARTPMDRRLRSMDATVTPWPLFVYDILDYTRMRDIIRDFFSSLMMDKMPEEPVSLSFWVASNLALSARDRLALFVVDNALLRLHMAVRHIRRKSVLCCSSCMNEIARRDHIFPMSSEGVHSNYTNIGGYMHDIVTVSRAVNTELSGPPSAQFSWFPGYTWTVALCAACMAHVGWRFDAQKRNLRPHQFYGLCRNYVQPRTDGDVDRHGADDAPDTPDTPDTSRSPDTLDTSDTPDASPPLP